MPAGVFEIGVGVGLSAFEACALKSEGSELASDLEAQCSNVRFSFSSATQEGKRDWGVFGDI